jgi:predicted RNA-binding Zn-ribbon protein involved in translation (DUF1610 family)
MPDKPKFFKNPPKGFDEDSICSSVLDLVKTCEIEDEYVRSYQLATWRRNDCYWESIQNIFWADNIGEWASIGPGGLSVGMDTGEEEGRADFGPLYDYVFNIYTAHGESIVAALSQSVPWLEFFPDNSDNPSDLITAKHKTKLSLIIQQHNKAKLKLMEILFRFFNQGMACILRYSDRDKKYGEIQIPKYELKTHQVTPHNCPACNEVIAEAWDGEELEQAPICPKCGLIGEGGAVEEREIHEKVGNDVFPRAKETWRILSPIEVKLPTQIHSQAEAGYAFYYLDINVAKAWNDYPDFRDDIVADATGSRERWYRTAPTYATSWLGATEDTNLAAGKRCWFRPWQLEKIAGRSDDEKMAIVEYLKRKFPSGLHVTIFNNKIVDAYEDGIDDSWVIRKCRVSPFLHTTPPGQTLIPLQDCKNQVGNLTVETIDYAIPATFADTEYLDFDTFGQQTAAPGFITPAKAPPGKDLDAGFHQQQMATLSKEVEVFQDRIDEEAQFITGDFPSIYGGPSEGSSRTLGEYIESGQRALSRLSIMFEHLKDTWIDLNVLSVDKHADELRTFKYNESMTQKDGSGYRTITANWDKLSKVGASHAECDPNFPISSGAKMALLVKLLQVPTPEIMQVLAHPENSKIIVQALGFPELYVPGDAQRLKALININKLLQSAPIEIGGQTIPSIEPEPGVDDGALQDEIVKVWLSDERGLEAKEENPAGYMNVKAYRAALEQMITTQTLQQNLTPPGIPPLSDLAQGATQ